MNVVTVAYLAVLRDVGAIVAGTDAAEAKLVPMADVLEGRLELAFDHPRIASDAIERVRVELEVSGVATAFVGSTFTLAELRAVYEAIWGVQLDAANFRRSVVSEDGWVIPTGRRAQSGPARPARRALPRRARLGDRRPDPSLPPILGGQGMKAVVHDRYGPPEVLRLEEVERPVPADDEVLVRVHATTVNRTDCHRRAAKPFFWRFFAGLRRPRRILGNEMAGEVEAVGSAVTAFAVGDRVFGTSGPKLGGHAEYLCRADRGVFTQMPDGLSFEDAAAIPDGALSALTCLRRAGLRPGQRIVVYGASGSIGTAGVQLARHFGADVTAVCNTANVELVRSLGADRVLDYTRGEDFTKDGESYDVVFDAVGKLTFRQCKGSLKPGGIYVATDGFRNFPLAFWTKRFGDKRVTLPLPTGSRRTCAS